MQSEVEEVQAEVTAEAAVAVIGTASVAETVAVVVGAGSVVAAAAYAAAAAAVLRPGSGRRAGRFPARTTKGATGWRQPVAQRAYYE